MGGVLENTYTLLAYVLVPSTASKRAICMMKHHFILRLMSYEIHWSRIVDNFYDEQVRDY